MSAPRSLSPRWILPAALAVLAGAGAAQIGRAADKYDKTKTPDKTTTAAVKPSLGGKIDSLALARYIDKSISQRLEAEKVKPSPLADDAEFLRRVYLDIAGRIPPVDKAVAFLDSKDPDKRAKLIDELLASEDYGKHQADVWKDLLVKRTSDNRVVDFRPLNDWLTKKFNENAAWDEMVRDLVAAEGPQDENGAVTYTLANASVEKMTDSVTKTFLGVQLQCAQCHNHPFTDWKQTEYWGMADFFRKTQLTGPRNPARQEGVPGVGESVGQKGRRLALPDSAKTVPAKFLGGPEVKLEGKEKARPILAKWMTARENPYFSKAMANRVWGQFFGRGIVSPVDDLNENNAPSHPQLMADLADQFAANGFDVKYLVRAVCNSEAYQRTSKPVAGNEDADPALCARMTVKVMSPEQQFDSLFAVLAPNRDPRAAAPAGDKAPAGARRYGFTPRDGFVAFFEVEGADPTEYEQGIPQALRLMNAPQLNNAAVLGPVLKEEKTPAAIAERLYLAVLSRRPTAAEQDRIAAFTARHKGEAREAYGDVLWALMNSSEFVLNH